MDIIYNSHSVNQNLTLNNGSKYYYKVDEKISVITAVGIGRTEDDPYLKFFYLTDDDEIQYIGIFELAEKINLDASVIVLFEDYDNRFFNDTRISREYEISRLKEVMSKMNKLTVKGGKHYFLEEDVIGKSDWQVYFRITNNNGMATLGRIATLTNKFIGKVFLFCASKRNAEEYSDAHSLYFVLCGIDIPPDVIIKYLTNNFKSAIIK